MDESQGSLRTIALLCTVGVVVRLLFLLLAGPLELQSDEANYVYLALVLDRFVIEKGDGTGAAHQALATATASE